jgi:hypothetical protein
MMRCVQCDTELVAPVRSEYWSEKHACHVWLCPKCCACFSSMVSLRADTDSPSCWPLWSRTMRHAAHGRRAFEFPTVSSAAWHY